MASSNSPATYLGKPCKNGHDGLRLSSNRTCVQCARAYASAYHTDNAERLNSRKRDWYSETADERRARHAEYRAQSKGKRASYQQRYASENKWRKAFHCARRHAAKLRATPAWADMDAIAAVYQEAARRTAETGVVHHVDHIYPLQGATVCGLHVQTNLQVLTAADNQRKYNRVE